VSEAGLICLVLGAIYLVECVAWGPAGVRAFRARPRRAWNDAIELFAVLGDRWRGYVAGIVPGAGGVAWAEERVVAIAPVGICACGSGGSGTPLAFDSIDHVHADGRAVRAGSRTLARVATAAYARALAGRISDWARLDLQARASRIESEQLRMLDSRRARRMVRRYRWCASGLVWPERALAIAMFVLVPAGLLGRGFAPAWPEVVLALAMTVAITTRFALRMRRLSAASAARGDGIVPFAEHVAIMLLAPPAAMRASDIVARETFGGLHAVTLARVAGEEAFGRDVAARAMRRARFPLEGERAACCEATAWSRRAWRRALEAWAVREFGSVEALLEPPVPESDAMAAYCQRCMSQYSRTTGECDTCPGVPLADLR
jgi:hypothetical protein